LRGEPPRLVRTQFHRFWIYPSTGGHPRWRVCAMQAR
jgi:hypothetical protein